MNPLYAVLYVMLAILCGIVAVGGGFLLLMYLVKTMAEEAKKSGKE